MYTNEDLKRMRRANKNTVNYATTIKSPCGVSKTVRVSFPSEFSDRVAGPDGRSQNTVESNTGRGRRMAAMDSGDFPEVLAQPLAELIEAVGAHEHRLALRAGVPPLDSALYELIREQDPGCTVAMARKVACILPLLGSDAPVTGELIQMALRVAANYISIEEHESSLEKLEDELGDTESELEELRARVSALELDSGEATEALESWEALVHSLCIIEDRLTHKDLFGTYGADDCERVLDLMRPVLEQV